MRSLEFIPKGESCIQNLCDFVRNCDFFSHIIIIDSDKISTSNALDIGIMLKKTLEISIIIAISLKNKNLKNIENMLQKAKDSDINGVVFVSGNDVNNNDSSCKLTSQFRDSIMLAKELNLLTLSATNDIHKAKERLLFGADFIITQSFYDISCVEQFLSHFADSECIIPSFLPFFHQHTLDKWKNDISHKLGIKIPQHYQISQNSEILRLLLHYPHIHISMINADFSNILALIKSLDFWYIL